MNVELAEKALRVAKANPERFDMDNFVTGLHEPVVKKDLEFIPPCGTTACFAGWVSFQAAPLGAVVVGPRVQIPGQGWRHVEGYAIQALEITGDQANALFYLDDIGQVEKAVRFLADSPDAGYWAICRAAGQVREDDGE